MGGDNATRQINDLLPPGSPVHRLVLVEVYTPGALRAPTRRIAHAELVGWTSDREVLVLESGRIIAIDVVTGHRRESSITTTSAGLARVVWR